MARPLSRPGPGWGGPGRPDLADFAVRLRARIEMGTTLTDIPGAGRPRRRGRRHDPWASLASRGPATLTPSLPPLTIPRPRRRSTWLAPPRPRRVKPVDLLLVLGFVALAAFLVKSAWDATRVDVDAEGIADGLPMTVDEAGSLVVRLAVDPVTNLERATLTLDGEDVLEEETEVLDDGFRWDPEELAPGEHHLELKVPRLLLPPSVFRWDFVVDDTPPVIDIAQVQPRVPIDSPVTVEGGVEPGATLELEGRPVELRGDRFSIDYDRPPAGPLHFRSVDPAGNVTELAVRVPVQYPGCQGVHMTAISYGYDPLREGVFDLIEQGRINCVELDLKDEGGVVGYDSQVPLAIESGAVQPSYDLEEAVAELHRRGVRVVGRIVAFRDPVLAEAMWESGRTDMVLQTPEGTPYSGHYGAYAFTNFANPEVQQYQVDIAVEAAAAGVDDILYDYVRRPDGDLATMSIPGLQGKPEDAIVDFLRRSFEPLRALGVYQGASVFGIAASRPDPIAQNIERMSRWADYISPMLYPSHWVRGEYGVDWPNAQPYDITHASLQHFQQVAEGSGATWVPWLQDFSLGYPYGPAEVQAQVQAACDLGVDNFLLWNALVQYTPDALDPGGMCPEPGTPAADAGVQAGATTTTTAVAGDG